MILITKITFLELYSFMPVSVTFTLLVTGMSERRNCKLYFLGKTLSDQVPILSGSYLQGTWTSMHKMLFILCLRTVQKLLWVFFLRGCSVWELSNFACWWPPLSFLQLHFQSSFGDLDWLSRSHRCWKAETENCVFLTSFYQVQSLFGCYYRDMIMNI